MKNAILAIWAIAALMLMTTIASAQLVEQGSNFEHYQDSDSHKLVLSKGTSFVQEDGTWKDIEHAKNLNNKGFEMKYLEQDEDFTFTLSEFNFTSFSGTLEVKNDYVGKEVPIKLYNKEGYSELNMTEAAEFGISMTQKQQHITVQLGKHVKGSVFEYIIHIGPSSTVVTFQEGGSANYTEAMNDCYLMEQAPTTNVNGIYNYVLFESGTYKRRVPIRFNLSQIPGGAVIEEANLTVVCNQEVGTSVIDVHCLTNGAFVESQATWNIYSTGNSWTSAGGDFNATAEDSKAGDVGSIIFNVTKCTQTSFAGTNYGYILKQHTESGGDDHYSNLWGSEASTASNGAKLTVRYSITTTVTNETEARTAVETAINSSEASTGTMYPDQQVYIRYLNATQKKGTFDIMLVKGLQRWLLKYKTGNETLTGMKSIGTTVNVWENQTLTAAQITSQVEAFINGTA